MGGHSELKPVADRHEVFHKRTKYLLTVLSLVGFLVWTGWSEETSLSVSQQTLKGANIVEQVEPLKHSVETQGVGNDRESVEIGRQIQSYKFDEKRIQPQGVRNDTQSKDVEKQDEPHSVNNEQTQQEDLRKAEEEKIKIVKAEEENERLERAEQITLTLNRAVFSSISQVVWSVSGIGGDLVVRFTVIEKAPSSKANCPQCCIEPSSTFHVNLKALKGIPREQSVQGEHTGCLAASLKERTEVWHFYVAVIKDLPPLTAFDYEIGEKQKHQQSDNDGVFKATVRTPGGQDDSEAAVFLIGDTGTNGRNLESLGKNLSMASLIVHVGDMSYATNRGECYQGGPTCTYDCALENSSCSGRNRAEKRVMESWVEFFERLQPISQRIPIVTTMGNHDNDLVWFFKFRPPHISSYPSFTSLNQLPKDVQMYIDKFQTDYKGKSPVDQQALLNHMLIHGHFYRVSVGPMQIVSITSEDNAVNPYERAGGKENDETKAVYDKRFAEHFGDQSPQLKWCEETLAMLDRKVHPVVLMFSHRPQYHTSRHHPPCQSGGDWFGCRYLNTYMPLMEKYAVDFFFSGHSHHYSRSTPLQWDGSKRMIKKAAGPDTTGKPVMMIVGNGGFALSQGYSSNPDWIAKRDDQSYGFGVMKTDRKTAEWTMFTSPNGQIMDKVEYTIAKTK